MAEVTGKIASAAPRRDIARYPASNKGREALVGIYLDASVLVPLVVEEAGSARAWAIIEQRADLWTSEFAAAEVASALSRLARTGQLGSEAAATALADFAHWRSDRTLEALIDTADIRLAHAFVRRFDTQLRVPDALHLALAKRLGAVFTTFDVGAARAASILEIEVLARALP